MAGESTPSGATVRKLARQSVVVVHGIGEQRPLETLRGFVGAVVERKHPRFSDPDRITDRTWARRFMVTWNHRDRTLPSGLEASGVAPSELEANTDFFELYWAPRFRDTTWSDMTSWASSLLHRPRLALTTTRLRGRDRWAFVPLLFVVIAFVAAFATVGMAVAPRHAELWRQLALFSFVVGALLCMYMTAWHRVVCATVAMVGAAGLIVLAVDDHQGDGLLRPTESWVWICMAVVGLALLLAVLTSSPYGPLATGRVAVVAMIPLLVVWFAAKEVFSQLDAGGLAETVRSIPAWLGALFAPLASAVVGVVVLRFGDVPRYTVRSPRNIEEIDRLQSDAVRIIERLHAERRANGDYTYERIVVVGHSLGSVIAYDALRLYWAKVNARLVFRAASGVANASLPPNEAEADLRRDRRMGIAQVVGELSERLDPMADQPSVPATAEAAAGALAIIQHLFWETIAVQSPDDIVANDGVAPRWIVSDLVTLGSPLAHAELLLAAKPGEVERNFVERIWPRCPPRRQRADNRSILFQRDDDDAQRFSPHQAAMFAACRWTNLYWGRDAIGGPIQPVFGPGVRDLELLGKHGNGGTVDLLRSLHSHYWQPFREEAAAQKRAGHQRSLGALRRIIERVPRVVVTVPIAVAQSAAQVVNSYTVSEPIGAKPFVEFEIRYPGWEGQTEVARRLVLNRPVAFDAVGTLVADLRAAIENKFGSDVSAAIPIEFGRSLPFDGGEPA